MQLETDRLYISELTIADAPFFLELVNDPDWIRFIGDRNVNTVEDAKDYLRHRIIPSYLKHGFGFYKVSLKSNGVAIGISGLVDREGLDHVDIGFAFLPAGRGKGYAYESTQILLKYAQDNLQLHPVLAIANEDNIKSHQLLKRLGLRFEKKVKLPNETEEICLFST